MIIAALAVVALVASTPPSEPPGTTEPATTTTAAPQTIPEGFVTLADSTDAITLAAPETWTDIAVAPIPLQDGSEVPYLAASPDLAAFYESFTVPGVLYVGFPSTNDLLGLVDDFGPPRDCASMELEGFLNLLYFGVVQIGTDCGPDHMTWNMVVANRIGEPHYTALVQIQSADDAERMAILSTFNVGPNAAAIFAALPDTTLPPPTN